MLKGLLNRVVAIGVLGELNGIGNQLSHKLLPVIRVVSTLNDDLDNAKAAVISGQLNEVLEDLVKNELSLRLLEALDDVLDHVSALRIE